jgi:hypothetical protein
MRYFRLTANAVFLLWTTAALGADAAAPAQGSSNVTLSNPLAAQSLERLSATVDRPLFSPSRRPPPEPVAQAPQPPTPPVPPPNLILSGVVMDGERARAVVRVGAEKRRRFYTRKLAITSMDGRLVGSRDAGWSCRSTVATSRSHSSIAKSMRRIWVTAPRRKCRTVQRVRRKR